MGITVGDDRLKPEDEMALEVEDLAGGYGLSKVLRDVHLHVGAGEVVAVVGKNGMGKTTFLKSISGLLKPFGGSIKMFGEDTTFRAPYKISRMGVSYVPQDRALFPDLTVQENVALALSRKANLDDIFEYIAELFPVLGTRRSQQAGTLSGGEQKMLLLARALSTSPRLLLIDEITEGLQPSVRNSILVALEGEIARLGMTVILVEQDLQFGFSAAQRYAVMRLGTIVEEGMTKDQDWREIASSHLSV